MANILEVDYQKKIRDGKEMYRAKIRFAPGPHGTVYTEWYIGSGGPRLAIKKLVSAFGWAEFTTKTS